MQENEETTLIFKEERQSCLIIGYTFIMFIYFVIISPTHVLGSIGTSDGCKDLVLDIKIDEDAKPSHD